MLTMLVCLGTTPSGRAKQGDNALEIGFQTPPASAQPHVWWHWMNGNVTKEGIRADLEWMKRIGIGGMQNFDASLATPRVVDRPLIFMTPEWKEAFRYATTLADEFQMEMTIAGSPGWSLSGGPWVDPKDGMKKYVWSETPVTGGHPFTGVIARPPAITGPFQNIPFQGFLPGQEELLSRPQHYADSRVVAFRLPDGAILPEPCVTSSGGQFDAARLSDGDLTVGMLLPEAPVGEPSWIAFDYGRPVTVRGVTLSKAGDRPSVFGRAGPPGPALTLQAGDDGRTWRDVTALATGAPQRTTVVPATTARYFRFTAVMTRDEQPGVANAFFLAPPVPPGLDIAELVLRGTATVNRFEEKAAFALNGDYFALATPAAVDPATVVRSSDVVDLTARMRPDGALDWTPPAGDWLVLRIGSSLRGTINHPASPEATGLEVDKLDRAAVERYINSYLSLYRDATDGLIGARGLRAMIFDSWEAGTGNWSPQLLVLFRAWRGYDPTPFLPVLAGYVVDSAEASDRFLWDFRRTIMQAVKENHYAVVTEALHAAGMIRYGEGHESYFATMADGMEMKQSADVPMAAMWTPDTPGTISPVYFNDIRESASVARLYGQNLVAAESFTASGPPFGFSPWLLKPTADAALLAGVNRFVIHTSVHQPLLDKAPGLTLGRFGQYFSRHETWAEQAGAWMDYLARASYLLQQGHAVSDIALFYGESAPTVALKFGLTAPGAPEGYQHDFVNADALATQLAVKAGRLVTPNGTTYRLLCLAGQSQWITLPTLTRLRDLVKAGAIVVGQRPAGSPSLGDDPKEVQAIIAELWPEDTGMVRVGLGKVYTAGDIARALNDEKIAPDFTFAKPRTDSSVLFLHRALADEDIYFLSNRNDRAETIEGRFRVVGKEPELWDAATGRTRPAAYRIDDGATTVTVPLDPWGSVFVVFRQPARTKERISPTETTRVIAALTGPWNVTFQAGRGAPPTARFDQLTAWNVHTEPGIKYFSGTAVYTQVIEASSDWFRPGARIELDLGRVENLAEITINGKNLGVLWKPPFRVDVTDALRPGDNTVVIKVTNLWINRMIGDVQPGVSEKITWTSADVPGATPNRFSFTRYPADAPLRPSGLLGPVVLSSIGQP